MNTSVSQPSLPPAPTLERVGLVASVACLIHCAAMPVLAVALPALGAAWLATEWIGWTAIGTVTAVAAITLPAGHERHRRLSPLTLAAAGIFLLVLGEVAGDDSTLLAIALGGVGAVGVTAAQILNRRFCRTCRICGSAQCAAPLLPDDDRADATS